MKVQILPVTLLSLLLVACGGSSGNKFAPDNRSSQQSQASSQQQSSTVESNSSDTSSSSSSVDPQADILTGILLDSAVANIGYRTETLEGNTSDNGEFRYRAGELITFFIGELEFPQVVGAAIITPLNFADTENINHPVVVNIARLLQSLDKDGNPKNGLMITDEAIAAAATLDFTLDPAIFEALPEVSQLLESAGGVHQQLIPAETALAHLSETLRLINGDSVSSDMGTGSSVSSSLIVSSSSSSTAPVIIDPTTKVDRSWSNFPDAAYLGILEEAAGNSNNPVRESSEPHSVDGLLFYRSGEDVSLRHRGGSNPEFNFNGASWQDGNEVIAPATGAAAPELRAYIAVPVEPGRALTLSVTHRNSSGTATAANIVFVGSNGLVLDTSSALANTATTTNLVLAAGHEQTHVKIAYSREGTGSGGMHFSSLSRVYAETGEQGSSSSVGSSVASSVSSTGDIPGNSSASSIDSSSQASVSSQGSSTGNPADIRSAIPEGFAAYANVTGGEGGPVYIVSTGTELNQALCGPRNGNRTAPVTILVNGTINHGNTTAQGCDTQDSLIEIKNTSNVSIIGVGDNALFDEIGIHVRDASNIIIQNVHIKNVKKSGSPTSNGGDAIGMERNVDRVWIDHNWLEASGGEKDGYDSLLDMKDKVTNVTVSYNLFNDSSRGGLVGSGDGDDENNNITFHHNWYKNIEQRTPLIRHALVHIYNNYWSNPASNHMIHAINARQNAKALVESNYFFKVNNPLLAGSESPQAGCWQTNNDNTLIDHIYTRTVGNGAHAIPEIIDGQMQSTCSVSVPYTVEMDAAADVPEIVMANAGVGKIVVDTEGATPITVPGGGSSSSSGASSSAGAGDGGEVVTGDWTASAMIMSGGHNKTSGGVITSSEEHVEVSFNGGKIESNKEGFFYVYKEVSGDFVFTASLVSTTGQTLGNSQGQIGIVLCAACENGSSVLSASARIGVTGNDSWGIIGEHRLDGATRNGHSSVSPTGIAVNDDLYFRIIRSGDSYTSYYSMDGGETWVEKNSGTFASELPEDVQIGVYGSQGHDSANGFVFENITLYPFEED